MKENKGVNVTKRSIRHESRRAYAYDAGRLRHLVANCEVRRRERTQDTGCQVDARRDVVCTCRMKAAKHHETRYFRTIPEQVYAYHGIRSYTTIGEGNVKTLHKRKVKKIYLPEMDDRGVGSSDVSTVKICKPTYLANSYYVPKNTSSKCVGSVWRPAANVSEKLSPIVKCVCATTGSEMLPTQDKDNIEKGNNTEHKRFATTTTQVESIDKVKNSPVDCINKEASPKDVKETPTDKSKVTTGKAKAYLARKAREEEKFSSDSLVQHVHDLECPSNDKPSRTSLDPMENKMEKEYRQIFVTKSKSKQAAPVKSTSILRRRFEALRRGLKKEETKKNDVETVSSSPVSVGSHKDVSIVSDPPSLEARSYYDPKPHSPSPPKYDRASFRQSVTGKKDSFDSTEDDYNEFNQGVSGMFKLWGKKFNLEDENKATTKLSSDASKEQENYAKMRSTESKDAEKRGGGKKFSFFKRRSKDKAKPDRSTYKTKKGVTTNRCEVKTGLVLKIGASPNAYDTPSPTSKPEVTAGKYEEMLQKAWLKKFLTSNIDSRDSVKIRWNNNTYATSSSTVFELMENVYKQTGIVIQSKSDIQTNHKPYKNSKKKGNFVNQNIEAWMIPRTITDKPIAIPVKINNASQKRDTDNIEVGISDPKWSIDKAKTFSHKIELVVHPNTEQVDNNGSSDFLWIDIGEDNTESCDDEARGTSDEKVYKIVEYETLKSNSYVKKKPDLDTGDHVSEDIRVTVSWKDSQNVEAKILETVIKRPPTHRDVLIQGSNVCLPKRCDVIGVGILTQRDVREMKPILKIHDDLSDDESETSNFYPKKNCEFAQSYLQDYYRQWMPLGMDPWHASEAKDKCSSERNSIITLNQGDGSKSCPNISEEYRLSTLVTPSHSSCSHCHNLFEDENKNKIFFGKVSKKQNKKPLGNSEKGQPKEKEARKDIRVLPKDSVEVFKKRKIYAASNKSKWICPSPDEGPYSVPSLTDRGAPDGLDNVRKRPCCIQKKKKLCKKHVSLPDCEFSQGVCGIDSPGLEGILAFKGSAGCASCKKSDNFCPKNLKLNPKACDIPSNSDPECKEECEKKKKPPCNKQSKPCPLSPKLPCLSPSDSSGSSSLLGCSNKCSTPNLTAVKPCPPPPPPSVMPRRRNSNSSNCPPQSSSYNCKVEVSPCNSSGHKKEPKPKKQVKCSTPPCAESPPKCGACITPPCSDSPDFPWPTKNNNSCPPSPTGSQNALRYPKKCPITGPLPEKPPKKLAECEPKCSNIPKCVKQTSDAAVDACPPQTPSRIPCFPPQQPSPPAYPPCMYPPPSYPQYPPSQFAPPSYPGPPPGTFYPGPPMLIRQSPPHVGSPPGVCSPTSTPPCPSPGGPCPAIAKLSKKILKTKSAPTCPPPIPSNPDYCTPPKPPSPPKSNPSIPAPYPGPFTPKPEAGCPALLPPECPKSCKSRKSKFPGLFLKKPPSKKKTCAEECTAWSNMDDCEHYNIRIKERTPSTDEIRELKIKDEDGHTLCERTEYKQPQRSVHRPSVLGEMYKSNICQRVSTKSAQIVRSKDNALPRVSSQSLDNLVEIQFTMKVTQGDKITEINIGNDGDGEEKNAQVPKTCSREVYVVNKTEARLPEQVASNDTKNDINIHIVIKNFKRKEKTVSEKYVTSGAINEDFSNKISQKFHTVSTGYSDVIQSDLDQNREPSRAFSVHRATWDLTGSDEKSKTQSKPSGDLSDFTDKEVNKVTTSQSATTMTESVNKFDTTAEEKSSWSEKVGDVKSDVEKDVDKEDQHDDEVDIPPTTDDTDLDTGLDIAANSNEDASLDPLKSAITASPKEQKKKMLKIVIEKAGKIKHKNKSKVSKLTKMLKAIMTTSESSEHADDMPVTNELAKDITYASLKPNFFRDTDSMNNFYRLSSMTSDNDDVNYTKENSSDISDNSFVYKEGEGCVGSSCLCRTVAAKLNVPGGGCCCSSPVKTYVNIDTNCDIRTDEESYVLNYGPSEFVDGETQRSKIFFSRANSANVSPNNCVSPIIDIDKLSNNVNAAEKPSIEKESVQTVEKKMSVKISANAAQIEIAKKCKMRKINRETILNISDEDKAIASNMEPKREEIKNIDDIIANMEPMRVKVKASHKEEIEEESSSKEKPGNASADVLQSYETKKAVLEIYTERTICDGRRHLVAKLPKFASEKESEIIKYEKIYTKSYVMSLKS